MPDRPMPQLDVAPTDEVRARMKRTRGKDTPAELRVRSLAHRSGLRFRVHQRPIQEVRSQADMVFRGHRVAVYIDGCFWHGCPLHATWPKKNASFWTAKILANVERDQRITATLESAGWRVVRVWEHLEPEEAIELIREALRSPR